MCLLRATLHGCGFTGHLLQYQYATTLGLPCNGGTHATSYSQVLGLVLPITQVRAETAPTIAMVCSMSFSTDRLCQASAHCPD
jgi:hypothetical protein